MKSLKHRTFSGIKWQVVNNFAQKGISVVAFAILARILEPATFGLFAMAFIAIDGFSLFKSFGIDSALIQRKDDRKDDAEAAKHTAFFLSLGIGIVIFILFQIAAPLAASLLKNDQVLSIMRALGVVFIFGCLGKIPNALLMKQMRFKLLSLIDFISAVVNAVCAVLFALISPNVWSLVLAYICKQITMASLSWWFERYHVRFVFDRKIAGELLHFGKFMVGLSLLGYLSYNLEGMVIGRVMGAATLGYYLLAFNISQFMNKQFVGHVGKVMFPAYVKVQHDREALKRAHLKAIRFISMISIPFGVVLISLAHEIVLGVYGEKWLTIVPLIKIFGIVQLIGPAFYLSHTVFLACGKPGYSYWLNVMNVGLKIPLLLIFSKFYGLNGAVFAQLVLVLIEVPVSYLLVNKIIRFSTMEIIRQLVPTIFSSLVMVSVILGVKNIAILNHTLNLIAFHHLLPVAFFCGVASLAYLAAFFFIDRPSVIEVKKLILGLERA